ncbi:hypothetical protein OE88DRAFT_1811841 [Heliocybe sulcata]|uniref:F-box domain-containing protein n=1 Tax=Heliocybe sulcata TaxID=5364 RepID=A0A5C3MQB4_9AGAM|nr:hypothetical protein OE88DRAFT_1811841 [Heliocybe sulcata]
MALAPNSGFHALPNELLQYIWYYAPRECSRVISAVCAYWRSVSLDTPSLWSRVTVSPLVPEEWLKAQLARSGQHPLTIDIRFALIYEPDEDFTAKVDAITRLTTLLSAYLDRCQVLRISLDEPEHDEALNELDVLDERRDRAGTAITAPLRDIPAPRLQELHINARFISDCCGQLLLDGMPVLTHLFLGLDTRTSAHDNGHLPEETDFVAYVLRRVRSVTHMWVGDCTPYVQMLEPEWEPTEQEEAPCPKLESLTWLSIQARAYPQYDTIRSVIDGRASFGVPLRKFRVSRQAVDKIREEDRAGLLAKSELELFDSEEEKAILKEKWMW